MDSGAYPGGRQKVCSALVVGFGLVFFLLLPGLMAGTELGVSLMIEPGFLTSEKDWLVPLALVDDEGTTMELPASDLRVLLGETPLAGLTLGHFAPKPGGYPSSSVVLVDRGFPGIGISQLVEFLDSSNTDARRALFLCGKKLKVLQQPGEGRPSEEKIRTGLDGGEPTRLWDCLLEAITALGQEGPVRKVLLVISDGNEKLLSQHPLATCVEAAVRTRVAVHVLELGGNSDGLSRLRELASRTGGESEPFTNENSLRRCLTRMDGARALKVPVPQHPLPAELKISLASSPVVAGTARIARQKALSEVSFFLMLGLGLGVLAVASGAVVLVKMNRRKVGVLTVNFQGKHKEMEILPSGLTMGSDNDNQLVLADQRISRHHAVIRVKAGEVLLTDLRSMNGTLVNGRPVRNVSLHHGDKIFLGKAVELTYGQHQ